MITSVVVSGTVGLGYLLSVENPGDFRWNTAHQEQPTADLTPSVSPAGNGKQPLAPASDREEPTDNAIGFRLAQVADQYSENIRYPTYSVPLSQAQANAYQGNHFDPVELPLPGGGQFTVTLEKYRFTEDEDILVVASLSGPQVSGQRMEATLETPQSRNEKASTTLKSDHDSGYYEGVLKADAEPGEYRLIVEATIDGKALRHVSTLTIEPDLGEFEGLGDAHISNNDLVIPVRFDAREPGFYSLSAQLFNNGQAIAQLRTEKRLDSTSDTLELKAHGSVLADRDISGELQLRHLQIRRLPAKPGDRTDYAFGPDDGYRFSPPDLDDLTDTPAGDPESEQRAALLQRLANKF